MTEKEKQYFTTTEKRCLQELVIKYKLNSTATGGVGNPNVKKLAWGRLTEEFNSIETNTKRTEAQLRKCLDNLKTRRKKALTTEKKERMRTGGGPYPGPSTTPDAEPDADHIEEALAESTDVEILYVIDSDSHPHEIQKLAEEQARVEMEVEERQSDEIFQHAPQRQSDDIVQLAPQRQSNDNFQPELQRERDDIVQPERPSWLGAKNVRTRVIAQEHEQRQKNYERAQKREEELHNVKMKTAEEVYMKAFIERQAAEELLLCHHAEQEAAELRLLELKNNN